MSETLSHAEAKAMADQVAGLAKRIRQAHKAFWPNEIDVAYYVRQTDGVVTVKIEPPPDDGRRYAKRT